MATAGKASSGDPVVLSWLQRQLALLQRERSAEHEQSHLLLSHAPARLLERHGLALLNLGVSSISTSSASRQGARRGGGVRVGSAPLGEQTALVELHRPSAWHADVHLPPHSFRTGDLCCIQEHSGAGGEDAKSKGKKAASADSSSSAAVEGHDGVVYSTSEERIVVAVTLKKHASSGSTKAGSKQANRSAQASLQLPERCRLVKVANDSTFDRMDQTMLRLGKLLGFEEHELLPAAAGKKSGDDASMPHAGRQADPEPLAEATLLSDEKHADAGIEAAKAEDAQEDEPQEAAQQSAEPHKQQSEDQDQDKADDENDEEDDEIDEAETLSIAEDSDDADEVSESTHPTESKAGPAPVPKLIAALLGLTSPSFPTHTSSPSLPLATPINPNLNASQLAAISFALHADPFALLHGPPGTGKTTTLVELIAQVVLSSSEAPAAEGSATRKKRVLVCAASNLAIDNLLERLVVPSAHADPERDTPTRLRRAGISVVRLGHPARVMPALVERTLDRLVSPSAAAPTSASKAAGIEGSGGNGGVDRAEAQMVRDVELEMKRLRAKLEEREEARSGGGTSSAKRNESASSAAATGRPVLRGYARKQAWNDLRGLKKEHEARSRRLMRHVLGRADVVLCTCHGSGSRILERAFEGGRHRLGAENGFDVVVVDEACQALEPAVWIPIMRAVEQDLFQQQRARGGGEGGGGVKLILAGDHLQLPPTVKDPEAGRIRRVREAMRIKRRKREEREKKKAEGKKVDEQAAASADAAADGEESEAELEEGLEDMTLSDVEEGPESTDETEAPLHPLSEEVAAKPLRPPRTLETTLFSRLLGMYGARCKALLEEQYRMNVELQAFPNAELYEGRLRAWEGCARARLRDLPHFRADVSASSSAKVEDGEEEEDEAHSAPLVFVDTAGLDMLESSPDGSSSDPSTSGGGKPSAVGLESKSNANEAALVLAHVKKLVRHGLRTDEIVVLAPYAAQVSLIREMLAACGDAVAPAAVSAGGKAEGEAEGEGQPETGKGKTKRGAKEKRAGASGSKRATAKDKEKGKTKSAGKQGAGTEADGLARVSLAEVEVGTVDGMQGREKEAVVLSLVRSNREGEVGFLAEKRRLNVAMTRAKRQLCVVGDSGTVGRGGVAYLSAWMAHLGEHALVVVPDELE
ncbi:hypothetical protein OC835_006667 [Tilletia horrida]|nr:hypothetical protein OC835_006667 [Tilletia horrida]